ncbi:MAG: ATP-binding protein, partial [Phycisphaerae bacterium]|nr:ATP-binding protein [Phycisphaerae bacterium]
IDLADILRWCIGQAQSTADDRSVAIDTQLHGATVVGIEDQLKMLFANVLSNAIVYSHEGGNVRVHCEAGNGNGPTVIFEDNGIGIAEKKVPRIFDEYYRTDEAARHNKESTGLGLTIVHHVASTHKIRVRVESVLGKGTKFTLNFPPTEQFQDTDDSGKEKGNGISADS